MGHWYLRPNSLLILCLALGTTDAVALTFYGTQITFTAASSTTLEATFESLTGGVNTASPVTQGRVVFASSLNALPFYVLKPGNPGDACCTFPHVTSAMLTGNGNEDFDMTFTGTAPTAVGFDVTTNNTGVAITVFDTNGASLCGTTLTQHNVATYLGLTSTVTIGRIHWFSQNLAPPSAQNSAVDNLRIGSNLAVPVQGRSWGLLKTNYR